jgi:hypothetical protein
MEIRAIGGTNSTCFYASRLAFLKCIHYL